MPILDDIASLKSRINQLKIDRARLEERLKNEREEKGRLMEEAKALGVEDPSKLSEWVEEKAQTFNTEKGRILKLIEAAEVK